MAEENPEMLTKEDEDFVRKTGKDLSLRFADEFFDYCKSQPKMVIMRGMKIMATILAGIVVSAITSCRVFGDGHGKEAEHALQEEMASMTVSAIISSLRASNIIPSHVRRIMSMFNRIVKGEAEIHRAVATQPPDEDETIH